ncbi:MAG: tRNA pseudouridine(38-40) synthase TruA [Acidimicrobiaceae bacterium]|nr:tRNA pseudouridine(38-40) synthase TruA [Acidimicrobiaceae bacterium]MBO0748036.1 tRNA pseudouridine(38-40) synthase TruA [Acidimicrobiaceae bacterium]
MTGCDATLFGETSGPVAQAAVYAGPTSTYRATVAYLGGRFHGFAAQPGQVTVAGVLSAALERSLRHAVELTCAGRTDTGVHAWGQEVSFTARADADVAAVSRSVNRALRPNVVVRSLSQAEEGFDARRWATGRRYRYTVLNDPVLDPFTAHVAWHVPDPLDLRSMQLACDPLIGSHDFSSFCRRLPTGSLVREVRSATWTPLPGGYLRFEIEASSFCQQMVRSLVGTLVEVGTGRGRRRAGEMTAILRARDRRAAGQLAPPHGLCLWEVTYPTSGPPPAPAWEAEDCC